MFPPPCGYTTDRPATTYAQPIGEREGQSKERARAIGAASSAARRTVRPAGAKRGPPLQTAKLSKSESGIDCDITIARAVEPAQPAQIALALICENGSQRSGRCSSALV